MYDSQQILKEYLLRRGQKESLKLPIRSKEFKVQNKYIDDRSRFKAANCTRRSGKSLAEGIDFVEISEMYPDSKMIYGGLTQESAAWIIWDYLLEMFEKRKIKVKSDAHNRIIRTGNGCQIKLFGVDASQKEMKKILGNKLRVCTIDEAGSMTIDLQTLCYQMVRPALIDLRPHSWLRLIGTCENIPNTFFEKVSQGFEPGWVVHKWSAHENPFVAKQWKEEIEEMLAENPAIQDTSWFKTHYLNIWCTDDDLLILPLRPEFKIDKVRERKYEYILGVDLGWNDATSFNVVGYSDHDPCGYIFRSYKSPGLDLTDTANEIKLLDAKYDFLKIVIDGANKQGVEEIRNRHNINLYAAEKTDKPVLLASMRDNFIQNRLKIVGDDCAALETEMQHLQWLDKRKLKEDPRCENHCVDGTLYAWREMLHYLYEPPKKKMDRNSEEYIIDKWNKEGEQMIKNSNDNWDNDQNY